MSYMLKNKAFIGALVVGALLLSAAPAAFAATSLSSLQVSAVVNLLSAFGVDSTTIANVQGILNGTGSSSGGSSVSMSTTVSPNVACNISGNLAVGSRGPEVVCLQNYLIQSGIPIAAGATGTFGTQTQAAVMSWQQAHGLPASGYFGTMSLAQYDSNTQYGTNMPTVNGPVLTGSNTNSGGAVIGSAGSAPINTSTNAQLDAQMNAINANMQGLSSDISQTDSATAQTDDSDQ